MYQGFPPASPGLRVGLLGGSFDPPHAGHAHITRRALRRFHLDQVWWLVSPGNPLKVDPPAAMARRLAAARALIRHPRVRITDLESQLGTRFTAETLGVMRAIYPGVRFVWLMGADNLTGFHRWERWRDIVATVPIGVLSRPDNQLAAGLSPTAQIYAQYRLPREAAAALPLRNAPIWTLLSGPMVEASSTEIRASGRWIR
ncbi:MAG: nicotinate-nucleotide adenylyltransferase [Pseudomonadota bacterium]